MAIERDLVVECAKWAKHQGCQDFHLGMLFMKKMWLKSLTTSFYSHWIHVTPRVEIFHPENKRGIGGVGKRIGFPKVVYLSAWLVKMSEKR